MKYIYPVLYLLLYISTLQAQTLSQENTSTQKIFSNTNTIVTMNNNKVITTTDVFQNSKTINLPPGTYSLLAMHPFRSLVAIKLQRNAQRNTLALYNTATQKEIRSVNLEPGEKITYTAFSPDGNYLVTATTRPRLVRIGVDTGELLPEYDEPLGLIDYFIIGNTSKNILTYQEKSGILEYHTFTTGNLIQSLPTIPELHNILSYSPRYSIGIISKKDLYTIDLTTGDAIKIYSSQGSLESWTIDPSARRIYFVERKEETSSLFSMILSAPGNIQTLDTGFFPSSVFYANKTGLLVTDSRENIYLFNDRSTSFSVVLEQYREKITDYEFLDQRTLRVKNKDYILQFPFSTRANTISPYNVRLFKSSQSPLVSSSQTENIAQRTAEVPEVGIVSRKIFEDHILTRSDTNMLTLKKTDDQTPSIEISLLGMNEATFAHDHDLILIAQSEVGLLSSSLIAIHGTTKETFPLNTEQFYTFDLHYNEKTNLLYNLGLVKNVNNTITTSIEVRNMKSPQTFSTGVKINKEMLYITLLEHGSEISIVGLQDSSVSWNNVSYFNTVGSEALRNYKNAESTGSHIAALDQEGSLVIFDAKNMDLLATVKYNSFLFAWELVLPTGTNTYPIEN